MIKQYSLFYGQIFWSLRWRYIRLPRYFCSIFRECIIFSLYFRGGMLFVTFYWFWVIFGLHRPDLTLIIAKTGRIMSYAFKTKPLRPFLSLHGLKIPFQMDVSMIFGWRMTLKKHIWLGMQNIIQLTSYFAYDVFVA